jgi:hypothetical protein
MKTPRPHDAIHHIDGDSRNNDLANLAIVDISENRRSSPVQDELGATVADARRLAGKAHTVFVHFRCSWDSDWKTSCVMLSRHSFLRQLSWRRADEPVRCRLYQEPSGQLWLQVG